MKAVLFDFNGTLFDDTRFHTAAWLKFTNEIHGVPYTKEQVLKNCIGVDNNVILNGMFPGIDGDTLEKYSYEKEYLYRLAAGATEDTRRLIDGVPEMLDMLTERKIPFALATSSVVENVNFYLNDLGLNRWFGMDRVVYDNGCFRNKPYPDFYIEAARRLNVPLKDCIIVEDSSSGIRAAENAECGMIVAMDRSQPRDVLLKNPSIGAVIHDFYGFERFLTEE